MPVVRNPHLYFTNGITWTRVANHVAMKSRLQPKCVFDSDSVRLTPLKSAMPPLAFMALFNSDIVSFLKMRFFQHTAKWEIGNLRRLPIIIPTKAQSARLSGLAELAMEAKRAEFAGAVPSHELADQVRKLAADLAKHAPPYLRPDAQQLLLATAADCLSVIERAVNLEAERLYGVEGEGPFDEF